MFQAITDFTKRPNRLLFCKDALAEDKKWQQKHRQAIKGTIKAANKDNNNKNKQKILSESHMNV